MVYQLVRKYEDAINRDMMDVLTQIYNSLEDACYALNEERLSIIDEELDFRQEEEGKADKDIFFECVNDVDKISSRTTFSIYELDERDPGIVEKRTEGDECLYFLGVSIDRLSEYDDCKVDLDWEEVRRYYFEESFDPEEEKEDEY